MATPRKKAAPRNRRPSSARAPRVGRAARSPRRLKAKDPGALAGPPLADLPEFLRPEVRRQRSTPESDPFRPPKKNCRVFCMHCQQKYDSYRIEWREFARKGGEPEGFWCCPIDGCGGKGFLFDIHPTNPNWEDEEDRGMSGGWFDDDGNPCAPDFADDIPF